MSRRATTPLLLLLLTSLLSVAHPASSAVADHGPVGENARITNPTDGSRVSGTAYRVTVADGPYYMGDSPQLYLDGVALGAPTLTYDSEAQFWSTVWDTTQTPNGVHKMQVGGYNGPNAAAPVSVEIANIGPSVNFTAPSEGERVRGTVTFTADAAADPASGAGITKVVFAFPDADSGGTAVTDFTAPYAVTVDTQGFGDGPNRVIATAYDSHGLSTSRTRNVTVDNVPAAAVLSPTDGATVAGVVTVRARNGDEGGSAFGLKLYIDGQEVNASPTREEGDIYLWSWDTRTAVNGQHQLQLGGVDNGTEGPATTPVTVTVHNVAPPAMTIRQSVSLMTAGQALTVAVTAQPGESVNLIGYSRPATTFRTLRTGTADSTGRVIFTLKPATNTRFYAASAAEPARKTGSLVVSVRPRLSLQAYQEDSTVIFWGMSAPCTTGRAVSVYRLAPTGRVLTATGRLDCRPNYANISVYKTFSGKGTFDFIAVTAADGNNAAAQSPVIRYTVR